MHYKEVKKTRKLIVKDNSLEREEEDQNARKSQREAEENEQKLRKGRIKFFAILLIFSAGIIIFHYRNGGAEKIVDDTTVVLRNIFKIELSEDELKLMRSRKLGEEIMKVKGNKEFFSDYCRMTNYESEQCKNYLKWGFIQEFYKENER